jgi:hypothetical protein
MRIFFSLAVIFLLCACKKEESTPEYNFEPVVAAYLNAGEPFSLQLSHQQSTSSTVYVAPGLDSLDIIVLANDSSYHLTSNNNGSYTNPSLLVNSGGTYRLQFVYNNKVVTASTVVPQKPTGFSASADAISVAKITSTSSASGFPDNGSITLSWDNSNNTYYLVVIQNMETTPERIIDTSVTNIDTSRTFRNQPELTDTYDIRSRSFTYFGKHRIILFHINADYAFLYDNTNNSSQSLSTPSTGITNGVGIFTGINSDTLYIEVNKK